MSFSLLDFMFSSQAESRGLLSIGLFGTGCCIFVSLVSFGMKATLSRAVSFSLVSEKDTWGVAFAVVTSGTGGMAFSIPDKKKQ